MDLIKRHKGLAVICCLTLILLVIIFLIFARMIFGGSNSLYGERLNDLVKIDSSLTDKLIEETESLEQVNDVSLRVQGKIIYITIKYKEGTKLAKAKEIATKTLTYYEDDIKNTYDFGYFLAEEVTNTEEEEKKGFLASGTKHPDNEAISWTKE